MHADDFFRTPRLRAQERDRDRRRVRRQDRGRRRRLVQLGEDFFLQLLVLGRRLDHHVTVAKRAVTLRRVYFFQRGRARLHQPRSHLLRIPRTAPVVPLREVAAEELELRALCGRLDALGDDGQVKGPRQMDDRRHDRRRLRLVADAGDEAAVDLEAVDREAPKMGE